MITRPPTRPQTLLRAFVQQAVSVPRTVQRRHRHTVPIWADQRKRARFTKHGVPGFLSAKSFQETYLDYTQHLCDELNRMVQGTAYESLSAFELHAQTAHRADRAALYNTAAMVEMTRLFWEALSADAGVPPPTSSPGESTVLDRPRPGLNTMRSIEAGFGSLEALREEMLETAAAMFGNGFVWLMKGTKVGEMRVLATYNAGSPYPEAAPRRDSSDKATYSPGDLSTHLDGRGGLGQPSVEQRSLMPSLAPATNKVGSFGDWSAARGNLFADSLQMQPILCVSVWQHQYLPDYGLLGKPQYLAAWWDSIDWQTVERRHALYETGGGDYPRVVGNHNNNVNAGQASVWDAVSRGF